LRYCKAFERETASQIVELLRGEEGRVLGSILGGTIGGVGRHFKFWSLCRGVYDVVGAGLCKISRVWASSDCCDDEDVLMKDALMKIVSMKDTSMVIRECSDELFPNRYNEDSIPHPTIRAQVDLPTARQRAPLAV